MAIRKDLRSRSQHSSAQPAAEKIIAGYQWGDPYPGESVFRLVQTGHQVEISAVMPRYTSEDRPFDLVQQYELAREARRHTKGQSKNTPHIQFINANSDAELIEFLRRFGPVVASAWNYQLPVEDNAGLDGEGSTPLQISFRAVQDLPELRREQAIYRAAYRLVLELRRPEREYDYETAARTMAEIANLARFWPLQWRRERKACGRSPLWKVRQGTIERIAAMVLRSPFEILSPQLDARIVLSELVNVFPPLVFPNPVEMHSYLCFGIRPLLYSLLRREFLHSFDTAVCINPLCRKYFEADRAGQQYCTPECSRQHRQRVYWNAHGKTLRKKRQNLH